MGAPPLTSNALADNDDAPGATTTAALMVGPGGATLAGVVRPNGRTTTYRFVWGKTTSYGSLTVASSAGSGSPARPVSTVIAGLAPSTTYHFRILATSSGGTTIGGDQAFATLPPPPLATTGLVSAVDATSAMLAAAVNPNGGATTYHLDIGPTTSYGVRTPATDAAVGSDSALHALAQPVGGLLPGTTYHYRAVATSASGVTYGEDRSFTTAGAPLAAPAPPLPAEALPPAAQPVLGRSATIAEASGTVLVTLPGGAHSLSLDAMSTVPVGTVIDARRGTVRLTNVRDGSGKLQTATFWGGSFTVQQARRKKAPTVLTLTGRMACGKSRHLTSVTAKRRATRQLWGRDNNGRFVTRGRSAVATVRGTAWRMRDTCAGTRVEVTEGEVSVRNLVKHTTVVVSAGHSYLARA